jgi:hypothetical protein
MRLPKHPYFIKPPAASHVAIFRKTPMNHPHPHEAPPEISEAQLTLMLSNALDQSMALQRQIHMCLAGVRELQLKRSGQAAPVPQSRASSVEDTMLTMVADALTQELPAPVMPTPAAPPVVAEKLFTSEASAAQLMRSKMKEQEANFTGNGSVFARFLSSDVISGGKAFLKPGVAGLQQYTEDINKPGYAAIVNWPTGFYRDEQTKQMQFFVRSENYMVIVEELPLNTGMPKFIKLPLGDSPIALRPSYLSMEELIERRDDLERILGNLNNLI